MQRLIPLMFILMSAAAFAQQVPRVPAEYLDQSRRLQGDQIRFCVLQDSVLTDLNESVAHLLGSALLVDTVIHDVSVPHLVQPLGYRSPLTSEQLFYVLNNDCDAFMGYLHGTGTYPDWLITTMPYMRTGFVLVSPEPGFGRLGDVPHGSRVGTQLGSPPNSRFLSLVNNLPDGQSWRRIPYPDNEVLLERIADGSLEVAMVWEPAVYVHGAEGLHVSHDLDPLPELSADFVITMIRDDAYLQSLLDSAIEAVAGDGALQNLFDQAGLPVLALP